MDNRVHTFRIRFRRPAFQTDSEAATIHFSQDTYSIVFLKDTTSIIAADWREQFMFPRDDSRTKTSINYPDVMTAETFMVPNLLRQYWLDMLSRTWKNWKVTLKKKLSIKFESH